MKVVKILFLADIVPYPPNTGIKIRTYNVIKELAANGNEVFLLAFNHKIFIADEFIKKKYITELLKFCSEVHIFEIPSEKNILSRYFLYVKNIFQRTPYRASRYYSNECIKVINNVIKNQSIDICHMDKLEFFKYAPFLKNIPIYGTNHNIESDLMRQRVTKEHALLRKIFAFIQWKKTEQYERVVLNKISGFVTCTESDASFFKKKYGVKKPHVVIENGVNVDYYQPILEGPLSNYYLIIGAQNKESTANFDATHFFLNKIWPTVKRKTDVHIKIVGRNPDRSIINYSKTDDRIKVIGYVDDEREIFGNALALLVPLQIGGGSRLKIFTAFGLGITVISTTKGAEGISYSDGENILIADSPDAFAYTMIKLWSDNSIAQKIGSSARQFALEKYDWKVLGKKLSDFYQLQTK